MTDGNEYGIPQNLSEALGAAFLAARIELIELDSNFVTDLETVVRTQKLGLVHPAPDRAVDRGPTQKLPKRWQLLLGCTQVIYQLVALWNRSSQRIASIDVPDESAPLEFNSALRAWVDEGQSLVEHLKGWVRLAARSTSVTAKQQRGTRLRAFEAINKYSKTLTAARVAQFHGLVSQQPIRAIEESGMWEQNVAMGHTPDSLQPYLFKGQRPFLKRWQRMHQRAHHTAMEEFAALVVNIVEELGWSDLK